jgi:Bcr/CflA subfamily drug resistance transporter
MNTSIALSEKRVTAIIWTLLFLNPLVGMAVDLLSPSLPAIASDLHVSNAITKDLISLYLLGYACGNFLSGFLTDALGRRKPLLIGLGSFIIASLLPVFYPHIEVLLLARLLQGLAFGTIAVVVRATFSDVLTPEKLIHLGVLMGSMFGLGPIIGPLLGGYFQVYFGWQACFLFFAIAVSCMSILICILIPETHLQRHALRINTITKNIREVVKHRQFMSLVIIMGAVYSLVISFNTVGPFLIQKEMHYSPIFVGHMALLMGIAFLCSTFISRHLLKYKSVEQLSFVFVNGFFALSILAVAAGYILGNSITLITLVGACMFFAGGCIFPMSMGKGMSLFRHIAGTASAIMFFINILMTSLSAFLLSFINIHSAVALFWIYAVLLAICMVVYWRQHYQLRAKAQSAVVVE